MTSPADPGYWDHPDDRNDPWPPPDQPERSTPMTTPSRDSGAAERMLEVEIPNELTGLMLDTHEGWAFAGERYRLASVTEYAALGEGYGSSEIFPLILAREADGELFEVRLIASATHTTPEQRDADRRNRMAIRERTAAAQEARDGAA